LEGLRAAVEERGLIVFALVDHSGEAGKRAYLCQTPSCSSSSPPAGTPIMLATPLAALDLPLKVLVWDNPHGGSFVSYVDPVYLGAGHQLNDDLGVWFAERPGIDPAKRPIREIVGVDPRLNQRWSTRRAHIVFLINAAAFLAVIAVIAWWRGTTPARVLPREHVGEAHWTPAG
jgi:hypothetical protein